MDRFLSLKLPEPQDAEFVCRCTVKRSGWGFRALVLSTAVLAYADAQNPDESDCLALTMYQEAR